MRSITAFDWRVFFESVSPVDEILRNDTNFGELDFNTRDSYRRAIEDLSRRSDHSEIEIARKLAEKSRRLSSASQVSSPTAAAEAGPHYRSGLQLGFERTICVRTRAGLPRFLEAPGGAAVCSDCAPGLLGYDLPHHGANPGSFRCTTRTGWASQLTFWWCWGFSGPYRLPIWLSHLVNRVATETLGPRKLPRFALREGVPPEMRTILVMPVLLTSPAEIERHLENLEVHYLANADGEIYFALVSDWADAPEEELSGDEELLADAAAGIARLNEKYPSPGGQRFFLFHRKRMWNESEGKWIGWERKRGKLQELNRLFAERTRHDVRSDRRARRQQRPNMCGMW